VIGIIGGSGIYEIAGLEKVRWQRVHSPFGSASDAVMFGEFGGQQLIFLPRHGRGHHIPPSELNFRANIDVLKRCGVTEIISLSAVGSLKEELPPGTFVLVDQFIDRTFARVKSFFGSGCVAHVSMADPTCTRLMDALEVATSDAGIDAHRGGTYLTMEGPQFSTRAEAGLYRSWGCSVIGMTNMPEAKLAREAEMCYATIAMVTDYDCWHEDHDDVSVETVMRVLGENAEKAKTVVQKVIPRLSGRNETCHAGCHTALGSALITSPHVRSPEMAAKLDAVAARVLGS